MSECEKRMQGFGLREGAGSAALLSFGEKRAQSHHGPKHHVEHSFQPQLRGALLR